MNNNKGLIAIAIAIVLTASIAVGYDVYKQSRPVCVNNSTDKMILPTICI